MKMNIVVVLLLVLLSCTKKEEKVSLSDVSETVDKSAEEAKVQIAEVATPQASPVATSAPTNSVSSSAAGSRILGSVTASKIGSVSFKVGGHISQMFFRAGDRVRKGQVLAALDESDYQLRVSIADAALKQAKNGLDQLKRDFEREERLKKENASTQTAYEKIETALVNAQLGVTQAQLSYEQAAKALADTKLRAAFEGIISKQFKIDGEYVGVGAPVYEIYDVDQIEVSLKIPEALMPHVKLGQMIEIFVPSINEKSKMKLSRIVPIIQEASRTFEVIGKPEDTKLMPGQFVEAQL